MKTKLHLPIVLGILTLIVATIGYFQVKTDADAKVADEIISLRKKHAEFLENSPFKETLKLTKKERKAQGIPPNRYFEQMWELTINPSTGRLDDGEISQLQAKLSKKRIEDSKGSRAPGDAVDNPWIERGPNDIGGRTRAMIFDPNDATNQRVYAGGVSGGLWVNNNITSASSSWSRVQAVPGNLSVTSITVDPRNSNIWYVGTGEQYTAGDVVGNGVYKTTDGGTTWTAVNIPPAGGGDVNFNASNLFISGIYYVNDIITWDNGSSTELFVGVGAHVYGDASNPTNWLGLQNSGLYRSTDGGTTWNRIETANMQFDFSGTTYYFIPNDFEIGADNRLWMGTITTPGIGGGGGGRVFSTTNGATWTEAAASPLTDSNRVELEASATNANKLYALTQGVSSPVHIYSTTNGFGSITTSALPNDADNGISANDFTRGQAFYDLMIEADPTNDNILYVGGIDLFRSTNGASSWTQISKWSNNPGLSTLPVPLVHADQHAMTFRPGNSNQAIFGNDGGIYYASSLSTAQNSSSAIGVRNNNYNVTQYVKAGIGPNGPGDTAGIFTAGAQDNGSQAFRNTTPGINGSEELSDGDGFYTFVDKDGQYMIATFVANVIYRFNLPWNGLGRRQGGATTLSSDQSRGDFVNQMDYDSDANRLLTNNSNASQNAIKSINVAANSSGSITNAALTAKPTAFRASPFANNEWLVGLANGGLLRLTGVTNNNASFATITTPFVGSVSSVRYGATANDIMVTIHNYGVASVWSSSNGGASWQNREGNLPNIPVRDILQNPLDLNEAILATQLGVWITSNFNDANPGWSQAYNGMSDASVTSFDYWNVSGDHSNNKIIASTYGRGVFTGSFTPNGAVIDNDPPTVPANLVGTNTTQTTVDLSWDAANDNIGVTGYDVYQDNVLVTSVAVTNYQVTGLTADTSYEFTVRAKDAAGNESANSNALNITTATNGGGNGCAGGISSFPYTEGFESSFGAWTQDTSDDFDWTRNSGGTPSNNTGPSSAFEGSFYVYVETSVPNNPSLTTILNSPCFDLTGETQANYTFNYHMTGNAVGILRLEASTDDGSSWTEIWSRSGTQGNAWNEANVNLDAFAGASLQLRYRGTSGTSWQGDMAVDNIQLTVGAFVDTQAPTAPTNLTASNITETSLDLTWNASTDNVGVTAYNVFEGSTNLGSVTGTSSSITGLVAGTSYSFTVVANDAAGNVSPVSNVVNVTTPTPGGGTTVLHEGFFETGLDGWIDGGGDCARVNSNFSFEGQFSVRLRDNSGTRSSMTLNNVDVSAFDVIEVEFYFYPNSMENGEDFWLRYNDGTGFTTVATYARGTDFENGSFFTATVTISRNDFAFPTNAQFRFQCDASGNNDQIYIDQVTIRGISNTSSATTSTITRLGSLSTGVAGSEADFEGDFMMYPNPVTGSIINLNLGTINNATYKIFNLIGQTVQSGTIDRNTIQVGSLLPGTYILELNDGEEIMTEKFIRQ